MPLLEWLERCALPEEQHLASTVVRRHDRRRVRRRPVAAGTTTSLVFGSHFAPGRRRALRRGGALRAAGDQRAGRQRPDAARAAAHHAGARPRRGVSAGRRAGTAAVGPLRRHAALLALGLRRDPRGVRRGPRPTSRAPSSPRTSTRTTPRWPRSPTSSRTGTDYVDTYDHHGLLGPRSVLAHNVHPRDAELDVLAARGTAVAHCPTQQLRARLGAVLACAGTSRRASASRSAATSVRAPASRSSRRACRPTSCSGCSGTTGLPLGRGPPAAPQHRGRRGGAGPRPT